MQFERLKGNMTRFYGVQKGLLARAEKKLIEFPGPAGQALQEVRDQVVELRGVVKAWKLAMDYVDREHTTLELPLEQEVQMLRRQNQNLCDINENQANIIRKEGII